MDAKTYSNEAYFAESFQSFVELRKSEQTCDISIRTSNNQIKAHKLVLASASEFFKNAIYGLFLNDSSKNELQLIEVQYDILLVIVDYMYTGKIEINSENVFEIFEAADYCLINFVKVMCLEFLIENLNAENCVKFWIVANNYKSDKLRIAAANTIFLNLEIASNTSEFLNLSNEEILDLLGLWPEDQLFDSNISAALKWADGKTHWEDTIINIFKDMSFTRISDECLKNILSDNELVQKSFSCNKWMMNIYKEKYRESESELKFTRFLVDQPIILTKHGERGGYNFFKYNLCDNALNAFSKIDYKDSAWDCKSYKKWIYKVGTKHCKRFAFDKPDNEYETAFDHNHGEYMKVAVLNDSMHIFGGETSLQKGSSVDLNTKQCTSFSLLQERAWAGVAVNDGSIYIIGGYKTNIVERFDRREGRTTQFGSNPFYEPNYTYAAALPNQIYCCHWNDYKMMDLRNNSTWINIKSPGEGTRARCLFSSSGRLFTIFKHTIFEYNNAFECWNTLKSLPESEKFWYATSFE